MKQRERITLEDLGREIETGDTKTIKKQRPMTNNNPMVGRHVAQAGNAASVGEYVQSEDSKPTK
jgi:hypothetical protein